MNQFRIRPSAKNLALALALSALAVGVTGCGKTNNDISGNLGGGGNVTQVSPKASVSGQIKGSDGAQLDGVTVSAGGQSTKTHDGGYWNLSGVPVSTTTTSSSNGGSTPRQGVIVAIQAPAGYMGASLTIPVSAQCVTGCTQTAAGGSGGDASNNSYSRSATGGAGGNGSATSSPQVVIGSDYSSSAGVVTLPALNATITGTLRNQSTGATISGATLLGRVLGVQFDVANSFGNIPGFVVVYNSGATFTLPGNGTTNSDGTFTFSGLPQDACIELSSPAGAGASGADAYNLSDTGDFNPGEGNGAICRGPHSSAAFGAVAVGTSLPRVNLNALLASASPNADTIAPWVSSVDHASYISGNDNSCGTFDSTVTNVVTLHFSEPVTVTGLVGGSNPATVLMGAAPNFTINPVTGAVLGSDNQTLTLTLQSPLPQSAEIHISIPTEDVADLAGNPLTANSEPVEYDQIVTTTNGTSVENQVDQLCFNTFQPNTQPTDQVTVNQIDPAQNGPDGSDAANLKLDYNSTSSLIDIVGDTEAGDAISPIDGTTSVPFSSVSGPGDIEQLNAFQDQPRTGSQLDDLVAALDPTNSPNVTTHVARVHVTVPAGTADIAIALLDPNTALPKDALFFPVRTTTGGGNPVAAAPVTVGKVAVTPPLINNGGHRWATIKPNGATDFDVIITKDPLGPPYVGDSNPNKPNPGDKVAVVARGVAGGNPVNGTEDMITLTDNVGPTVALQLLGCNATSSNDCATQALQIYGQGGVVFNNGPANPGTVVLYITPQSGDTSEASTVNNGTPQGYYFDNFVDELFAHSGAAGNAYVPTARYDSAGQLRALTDATGTAWYFGNDASAGGAQNARISINVDEHVTTGPGALPGPGTNTASTLSNFVAYNSVNAEDGGAYNDQVTTQVSSIVANDPLGVGTQATTLQNDAINGKIIDLTGGITDLAGNTATAANNAKVVLNDKFPPLMTYAFTDGANSYFEFNEPILKQGSITLIGCGITVPLNDASVVLSADGKVVQIPSTVANLLGCFSSTSGSGTATYAEPVYTTSLLNAIAADVGGTVNSGSSLPAVFTHAEVGYRDVPDAQGNIWDCSFNGPNSAGSSPTISNGTPASYCNSAPPGAKFVWAGTNLGMAGPSFEMINVLGPFQLTFTATGFTGGSSVATFEIRGSHPIGNWVTDQGSASPNPVSELFSDLDSTAGGDYHPSYCINTNSGTLGVNAALACTYQAVLEWGTYSGSTCTIANDSTTFATLSADQTTLTAHVTCSSGTFTSGDVIGITTNSTHGSAAFDTARSMLDGTTQNPVSHQFNAN